MQETSNFIILIQKYFKKKYRKIENILTSHRPTCKELSTIAGLAEMWQDFLGTLHSLLSQFLLLVPDQRLYIVKNVCMCVCVCVYTHTHISDCLETVYVLPLLPNNTAVKHFYTNRERCGVSTGYLSLGRRSGGDWANT